MPQLKVVNKLVLGSGSRCLFCLWRARVPPPGRPGRAVSRVRAAGPSGSVSHRVDASVLQSLELALSECQPHCEEQQLHAASAPPPPTNAAKGMQQKRRREVTALAQEQEADPPSEDGPRFNEMNVQMIPTRLRRQLFGPAASWRRPPAEAVERALQELAKHELPRPRPEPVEDPGLRLPALRGANVEEHFWVLGEEQSAPYRALLQALVAKDPPPLPDHWELHAGWTRYERGRPPEPVAAPACDSLVLDVEVCRSAGDAPILATTASPAAWYCWVSSRLAEADSGAAPPPRCYSAEDFLPLESGPRGDLSRASRPRVVVGHNVSYDRARVREEYWLEPSGTRFVDTMAMHVSVAGLTSYQRATLRSAADPLPEDESWRPYAALNSLAELHRLYCGAPLEKAERELFVSGNLAAVHERFQQATTYCARDVLATQRVLVKLLPLFLQRFPHPATLAGMLELGRAYLPVNSSWPRFLAAAERTYEELQAEMRLLLARRADLACRLMHGHLYQRDPWMWDQEWSCQELKLIKTPRKRQEKDAATDENEEEWPEKFRALAELRHRLPARRPLLPGYPAWYRRLCERPPADEDEESDWVPGPQLVSTGMQLAPKLLRLAWESYPLHYIREHGWGFLVPRPDSPKEEEVEECGKETGLPLPPLRELRQRCTLAPEAGLPLDTPGACELDPPLRHQVQDTLGWAGGRRRNHRDIAGSDQAAPAWYQGSGLWCSATVGGCWFLKLPHKDGASRVGNPLAKDFLGAFSERVLVGEDATAERVLDIAHQLSYWRNNRERVLGQLVGWLPPASLPRSLRGAVAGGRELGAIIPQVAVCGTLTRRAVEPTWMTAANARPGRLGSELRSLVQAPPGHRLVGADVDSQELWIAAAIGDASFAGLHGATPFGWMTLSGRKADGTDLHSVTAAAAGVSRDHAKVLNYARIYGAGRLFSERLLRRFNPAASEAEARVAAGRMFALTKGRRKLLPRAVCAEAMGSDHPVSATEARRVAAALGMGLGEAFHPPHWEGGTESAMFNRLEEIAGAPEPATPFLQGRLSRALEAAASAGDDTSRFIPTRINWVVQSGAVDFLHLMLVSMRWLQPRARFCLSFHDEVRYVVPEAERYRAALALHATNLLARAFCARRLGLDDLPLAVAFFAAVEVDGALRKEAHMDCVTPSNPHGLLRGYGVPAGESLDVLESVRCTGGMLRAPRQQPRLRRPADKHSEKAQQESS